MPSVSQRFAEHSPRFERPSGRSDSELLAPVILMVSGGADSSALLVMAATSELDIEDGRGRARIARERLHVLHINHELRGIDAKEDEEFVCELACRFGIPITVKRVNITALAASEADSNIENVGREVRYAEANKLANELCEASGCSRSAARILTAHNANDRAETFFMNAIRGTGAPGLSSIPRRRNRIVRPLLDRTHDELCEYLRMKGIVWREDATNADTRYLRSYVRHELMPVVEKRNPKVMSSLASTCDILSDEDAYLTAHAERALRELTRRKSDELIALDAARLAAIDIALARRIVRSAVLSLAPDIRLDAHHINRVLECVAAQEGSLSLPLGVSARVAFGLLIIRMRAGEDEPYRGPLKVPGEEQISPMQSISAQLIHVVHGQDPVALARAHGQEHMGRSVLLDAEACGLTGAQNSLWLDSPRAGDVLCPLGMHGQSKKLADLLNEEKVALEDKAKVCVVRIEADGAVVWVAGIRADERVKVLPQTKLLVELSITEQDVRADFEGDSHADAS